jgi:hypothetical protein
VYIRAPNSSWITLSHLVRIKLSESATRLKDDRVSAPRTCGIAIYIYVRRCNKISSCPLYRTLVKAWFASSSQRYRRYIRGVGLEETRLLDRDELKCKGKRPESRRFTISGMSLSEQSLSADKYPVDVATIKDIASSRRSSLVVNTVYETRVPSLVPLIQSTSTMIYHDRDRFNLISPKFQLLRETSTTKRQIGFRYLPQPLLR